MAGNPNLIAFPSTGEPPDSSSTEALVAERFAEADAARREWLTNWLLRERQQKVWLRAKATGRRGPIVRDARLRADAVVNP